MATVASLIEAVSVSGYGATAASGKAYFYSAGTTVQTTVYQDSAGATVYAQPIALDANGRSVLPVYALGPVRAQVFTAAGALVIDVDQENVVTAGQVALNNANWSTSPTLSTALDSIASSNGAGNGLVKAQGAGTVTRTLQAKLGEAYASVFDFGAVGDGVTDDTAAIQRAFSYIEGKGSGEVRFGSGTFLVEAPASFAAITWTNAAGAIRITGVGRATIVKTTSAPAMFSLTAASVSVQAISVTSTTSSTTPFYLVADSGTISDCYGNGWAAGGGHYMINWNGGSLSVLTLLSSSAFALDGVSDGALIFAGTGQPSITAISCRGQLNCNTYTAISCVGDKTGVGTVVGGSGTVTVGSGSSSVALLSTNFYANTTFVTDNANDKLYTVTSNSTTSVYPIQGMIVVKANTAGTTQTVGITNTHRWAPLQVIRFWNNSGGVVTWVQGAQMTFRAGAPAPAAGNSTYVTFAVDHQSGSWVEVGRT